MFATNKQLYFKADSAVEEGAAMQKEGLGRSWARSCLHCSKPLFKEWSPLGGAIDACHVENLKKMGPHARMAEGLRWRVAITSEAQGLTLLVFWTSPFISTARYEGT